MHDVLQAYQGGQKVGTPEQPPPLQAPPEAGPQGEAPQPAADSAGQAAAPAAKPAPKAKAKSKAKKPTAAAQEEVARSKWGNLRDVPHETRAKLLAHRKTKKAWNHPDVKKILGLHAEAPIPKWLKKHKTARQFEKAHAKAGQPQAVMAHRELQMSKEFSEMKALFNASIRKAPALMMETIATDSNRGVTSRGNSHFDKYASPQTREKVLQSRMQEIEAFANSRSMPAATVFAATEASMRTGKVPDLGQYGMAGDDAVALKQFIISNVMNIQGLEAIDYKGDPVEETELDEGDHGKTGFHLVDTRNGQAISSGFKQASDADDARHLHPEKKHIQVIDARYLNPSAFGMKNEEDLDEGSGSFLKMKHKAAKFAKEHGPDVENPYHLRLGNRLMSAGDRKAKRTGADSVSLTPDYPKKKQQSDVDYEGPQISETQQALSAFSQVTDAVGEAFVPPSERVPIRKPKPAPHWDPSVGTVEKRKQMVRGVLPHIQKAKEREAARTQATPATPATPAPTPTAPAHRSPIRKQLDREKNDPKGVEYERRLAARKRRLGRAKPSTPSAPPGSQIADVQFDPSRFMAEGRYRGERTAPQASPKPGAHDLLPKKRSRGYQHPQASSHQSDRPGPYGMSKGGDRRLKQLQAKMKQQSDVSFDPASSMSEGSTKAGGYPYDKKAKHYRGHSDAELDFARRDAIEASRAAEGHDPHAASWYANDSATIRNEQQRRAKKGGRRTQNMDTGEYANMTEQTGAARFMKRPMQEYDMANAGPGAGPYANGGVPTGSNTKDQKAAPGPDAPIDPKNLKKSDLLPKAVMAKLKSQVGDAIYGYAREDLFRLARERGLLGTEESVSGTADRILGIEKGNPRSDSWPKLDPELARLLNLPEGKTLAGATLGETPEITLEDDYKEHAKKFGGKFAQYVQGNVAQYDFQSEARASEFASFYTSRTTATPKIDGTRVFINEPHCENAGHTGYGGTSTDANATSSPPVSKKPPTKEEKEEEEAAWKRKLKERTDSEKILGIVPGDPRADAWPQIGSEMKRLLNLEDARYLGPKVGFAPMPAAEPVQEATVAGTVGSFLGAGMRGKDGFGDITTRMPIIPPYDDSQDLSGSASVKQRAVAKWLKKNSMRQESEEVRPTGASRFMKRS
jgi:hypothetical protein